MKYASGETPEVGDVVERIDDQWPTHPKGMWVVVEDIRFYASDDNLVSTHPVHGKVFFNADSYILIRAWTPQPGEMVEVCWGGTWLKEPRKFSIRHPNGLFLCEVPACPETLRFWEDVRPIKKTHTVTIDGQDYEISDELYKQIV